MDPNYWSLGTWRRVPVSMHWTVLFAFAWLYIIFFDVGQTLIGSAAYALVLVVHELGHVAVLRTKRIAVLEIRFFGVHGSVHHAYASPREEVQVAWAGVAAQLALLAAALAARSIVAGRLSPIGYYIAHPVFTVLIGFNVFLMIVALLPIGPFDGQAAWRVFGMMRAKRRRKAMRRDDLRQFPERALPEETRRELEEKAARETAELLGKLGVKPERDTREP
jgi:Zn-dependent protease